MTGGTGGWVLIVSTISFTGVGVVVDFRVTVDFDLNGAIIDSFSATAFDAAFCLSINACCSAVGIITAPLQKLGLVEPWYDLLGVEVDTGYQIFH